MSKVEIVMTAVLGLLGLGIMAGQGFHINGWVLFFWGAAVLVVTIAVVHRWQEESGTTSFGNLSPTPPTPHRSTLAIRIRKWASGDPIPDPDFPILVQTDRISMTSFNAVPDSDPQDQSNLFAVVHAVTLTNIARDKVVAFLELIVPRQKGGLSGGIRATPAEIDEIPKEKIGATGPEPLGTKIVGVQLKRIVNIDPRSSVIGYVGFRLSGELLDGRFGTSKPYRNIESFSDEERFDLADMSRHAALRVTNQLDGSYRDFPVMQFSRARAKWMEAQVEGVK